MTGRVRACPANIRRPLMLGRRVGNPVTGSENATQAAFGAKKGILAE